MLITDLESDEMLIVNNSWGPEDENWEDEEDEDFEALGVWDGDEKDGLFEFEDLGWITSVLFFDLHIRKRKWKGKMKIFLVFQRESLDLYKEFWRVIRWELVLCGGCMVVEETKGKVLWGKKD